jgi:hypothetical protein
MDAHEPHVGPQGRRCVFVRVWRRRFTPEQVVGGDIVSDDVGDEVICCLPDVQELTVGTTIVDLAIRALERAGTTEAPDTSCPHDRYEYPDGSYVTDHDRDLREQPTACLYGFTDDEQHQLARRLGVCGGEDDA